MTGAARLSPGRAHADPESVDGLASIDVGVRDPEWAMIETIRRAAGVKESGAILVGTLWPLRNT